MSVTKNLRRVMTGAVASATAASALFSVNPAQAQSEATWWNTPGGFTRVTAQFLDQASKAVPSDIGDIPGGFLSELKDTVKVPSVKTRAVQFPTTIDAPNDGKMHYNSKQLTFFAIVPPTGLTAVAMSVCGELNREIVYYGAIRADGKVMQLPVTDPKQGCTPPLREAARAIKNMNAQTTLPAPSLGMQ